MAQVYTKPYSARAIFKIASGRIWCRNMLANPHKHDTISHLIIYHTMSSTPDNLQSERAILNCINYLTSVRSLMIRYWSPEAGGRYSFGFQRNRINNNVFVKDPWYPFQHYFSFSLYRMSNGSVTWRVSLIIADRKFTERGLTFDLEKDFNCIQRFVNKSESVLNLLFFNNLTETICWLQTFFYLNRYGIFFKLVLFDLDAKSREFFYHLANSNH